MSGNYCVEIGGAKSDWIAFNGVSAPEQDQLDVNLSIGFGEVFQEFCFEYESTGNLFYLVSSVVAKCLPTDVGDRLCEKADGFYDCGLFFSTLSSLPELLKSKNRFEVLSQLGELVLTSLYLTNVVLHSIVKSSSKFTVYSNRFIAITSVVFNMYKLYSSSYLAPKLIEGSEAELPNNALPKEIRKYISNQQNLCLATVVSSVSRVLLSSFHAFYPAAKFAANPQFPAWETCC